MGRRILSLDSFKEDELITTATAAKALRLKESSLMTYIYNGYIPCVRNDRGVFVRVSDAKAFISGGRKKTYNHKARIGMVYSWNNYVMPLILLNTQSKFTMPMLVQLLRTDIYATDYGALYLGLALTILPLIVIYLVLSKAIIRGVTMGSVKE